MTYRFDDIIGHIDPVIYDESGAEYTVEPYNDDSQYIKPCDDATLSRLDAFCNKFVEAYSKYTSGVLGKYSNGGYAALQEYVQAGSDLDKRLFEALDGLSWAHTNSYSLDLSRLITDSRKSMYLLEIKGGDPLIPVESNDYDYYFGDYRTYAERSKVVIQSDIGIICKSSGDGELIVYTTDLVSARPKGSCKVRAYDRQNQQLAEAVPDSEAGSASAGRAVLICGDDPLMVLAEANGDAAFVRVERGAALSLSNFDVGGTTDTKGIKGYLFGERGVWRPGDEIYLTLIVASDNPLPENHPASLEFYNPNGQ